MAEMASEHPPLRTICVSETAGKFFVAVKEPFEEGGQGYDGLDCFAEKVCVLEEGSQIFVYDRNDFGTRRDLQAGNLREYIEDVAAEVGGIALYPTVRSLNERTHGG